MSEEIATAAADLETVRQLRAALAVALAENDGWHTYAAAMEAELAAARAEIARLTAWQSPAARNIPR